MKKTKKLKNNYPYWFMDNTTGSRQSFKTLAECETEAQKEPGMAILIHTPDARFTVKASGRVEYKPFKTMAA